VALLGVVVVAQGRVELDARVEQRAVGLLELAAVVPRVVPAPCRARARLVRIAFASAFWWAAIWLGSAFSGSGGSVAAAFRCSSAYFAARSLNSCSTRARSFTGGSAKPDPTATSAATATPAALLQPRGMRTSPSRPVLMWVSELQARCRGDGRHITPQRRSGTMGHRVPRDNSARSVGRGLGIGLGLATAIALTVVVVPVLLLRPFSPQTAATLKISYALRTASPWIAPAATLLAALLGVLLLRRGLPRPKAAAVVLAVAAAGGAAWMSFQNHFEWMFAPLPSAQYARARDTTFVDAADMVVAVEVNGDAVAYPVRMMAYHHLLNDEVGRLPVVSTY
jgi:hypothetical protein